MADKRRALGKGLSALLKDPREEIQSAEQTGADELVGSIAEIPVEHIVENPFQPRTHFDAEALSELAHSIRELGIIQPITVRRLRKGQYQLISGERRLRASKIAGLERIPAYIRLANDQGMLEMALVENIQRQELDAIEIALSYQRLIEECALTQEQMSERVGKKRSTVTNYLRLLRLPPLVQAGIRDRMIGMGHARALVNIEDEAEQLALYRSIVSDGLSVRAVEDRVQRQKQTVTTGTAQKTVLPPHFKELNQQLSALLGTKVQLLSGRGTAGKIVVEFKNERELERILSLVNP
ncbi:ParB/RepB/Spo0J family partition protein [bacterium]|nr:ParB/RepB/Spo0J family partition protein [bacterium]